MLGKARGVIAAVAIAVLFAAFVQGVSANRLSIGSATTRITWTRLEFIDGNFKIICAVTMEASFHSATIRKVSNLAIGDVSRASAECGGNARLLRETLPWHVQYSGFIGRLPAITGISLSFIGVGFLVETGCLATATELHPWREIAEVSAGSVTELVGDQAAEIPVRGESCAIFGPLHYEGVASMTNGAGGALTIRLI